MNRPPDKTTNTSFIKVNAEGILNRIKLAWRTLFYGEFYNEVKTTTIIQHPNAIDQIHGEYLLGRLRKMGCDVALIDKVKGNHAFLNAGNAFVDEIERLANELEKRENASR